MRNAVIDIDADLAGSLWVETARQMGRVVGQELLKQVASSDVLGRSGCYGTKVRELMRDIPRHCAPAIYALTSILEAEGHDMADVLCEVEYFIRLASTAYGW